MGDNFNWTCPHCGKATTIIADTNAKGSWNEWRQDSSDGRRALYSYFILCPNMECRRLTLTAKLFKIQLDRNGDAINHKEIAMWQLIPDSHARVYDPAVVPSQIISSYVEACRIASLSPMASATLSRRAIQGVIRQFWNIKLRTLKDEVNAIKEKVDPETWDAIEAVRNVGNIGAHMERDTDLIQEVEPEEAEKLIWLVETLVEDTFVARAKRASRLAEVKQVGEAKKAEGANLIAAKLGIQREPAAEKKPSDDK